MRAGPLLLMIGDVRGPRCNIPFSRHAHGVRGDELSIYPRAHAVGVGMQHLIPARAKSHFADRKELP